MSEFYIKASEAARRIGVSLVTAKRMISDGRLIGEKIGSRWQILERSVFDYLGKNEEEVNKNEVDSAVSTAQNPLEPVQNGLDTADSGGFSSSVVSVGDVDISRMPNPRARGLGSETFPEHSLLVDEFGHMFGSIQLNADQFWGNCLRFVDDYLWIYWRPSFSQYALEELSYDLKATAPIVDLLSMSLYDVVKWVVSLHVYGGSRYNGDDYENGVWRVELRRALSENGGGDQLYRRCAYSYPFEFRSGSYESQDGGIFSIENGVTEMTLDRMNGVLNGS